MHQYERKGKDGGINNRTNAAQLAKKDTDSNWESIVQLAKKRKRKGTAKKNVDLEDDSSSEELYSDEEESSSEGPPRKISRYNSDSSSSEEDSDDDYVEKKSTKTPRFTFGSRKVDSVIENSAHKRENYDKKKFKAVYTCPACRRPIASIKKGSNKMNLVPFSYHSKKKNTLKTQRSAVLDHYPPWAERYAKLKSENATDDEIREDHDDESRLRALCKKCNESHKFENKKTVDYDSDTDESGYDTDTDESDNVGRHSPFKYFKDEDKDKDGNGGTGGITA